MQVEYITENPDGSANVAISNISPEELRILVQEGLIAILTRQINIIKMEHENAKVREETDPS